MVPFVQIDSINLHFYLIKLWGKWDEFYYEIQSSKTNNSCSIALVKWFDNKLVNMASNYVASGVIDKVKRYDKKKKFI